MTPKKLALPPAYVETNNFAGMDELTVTITLAEYRRLVEVATLWCANGGGYILPDDGEEGE